MFRLKKYYKLVLLSWKYALSDKVFSIKLLLLPGLFLLYSAVTQKLGIFFELRKGVQLPDKLLYIIPTFDFSLAIFLLLYSSIFLIFISHLHKPKIIYRILELHLLVAVVRQICIFLVALEPPIGIIVLRDIFLENTIYPRFSPLTKDLFFSGHVASIWIYFLIAQYQPVKKYLFFATILMSFMILSMKVHYTYDVYAAILFTTLIYYAPYYLKNVSFFTKSIFNTNENLNK